MLTPQELHWYWFGPNIGIKRLRISTLFTPYQPTPIFLPTYPPPKGSHSYQPSLSGPIDTNSTLLGDIV